jgi:GNAT superfamily N-acetyltransferase
MVSGSSGISGHMISYPGRYRRVALTSPGSVHIRPASLEDVELIFSLIVELATYERAPEQVTGTPALLTEALFGPDPSAEALVAELNGQPVAFALFHGSFSTWECRAGIWLEDLYVPPEHRGAGLGRALLCAVAAIAVQRGCARLEWAALDWNELALGFYAQLHAKRLDDWVLHRLDGEDLKRIAAQADGDG